MPPGDATQACNRLLAALRALGHFVVDVGELEGFSRSVGGHRPKWVNSVIAKNLAQDPELQAARVFTTDLLSF